MASDNPIDDYWVQGATEPVAQVEQAQPPIMLEGVEPLDAQFGVDEPKTVPDALLHALFGKSDFIDNEFGETESNLTNMHDEESYVYAILDAAQISGLPELLETSGLEYRCLFKGEAYEELRDVAPWIVQLKEGSNFVRNLFTRSKAPWHLWDAGAGVFVQSRSDLNDVWAHFRKFTKVQDEEGRWYYQRYWEPTSWYPSLIGRLSDVQSSILSGVARLIIHLNTPLFGSRWVVLEGTEHVQPKALAKTLRMRDLHDAAWSANTSDCLRALSSFAEMRIKGLGLVRTLWFVEHAVSSGDKFDLEYRDQIAYLMFLMNFLGSYFWTDPRYKSFHDILTNQDLASHNKIDALHELFSRFSNSFIGDDYGLYWDTLEATQAQLPTVYGHDGLDEVLLETQIGCHAKQEHLVGFPRHEFLLGSRQAARIMEMDSPKGYQASVVLSYWFGTSYYADPLFPWIRAKILEKSDADAKADNVLAYAVKRLKKTKGMRSNVL
ncbi:DUF4123 domain-containing protein [Litoreibacter arenae]|uniref:DUF4123 domain-containing protein n=1 Tax=Litoreibacter arenae DSM 19593 TaxID=1123360 RepID=S9QQC7_9RHOB|nr:DUF4123 domain-containing protein [Litoreibacter arenae]EPX81843.1 hypothetical protein thalar_00010 [Litoreibacter arenae DSM 19593]